MVTSNPRRTGEGAGCLVCCYIQHSIERANITAGKGVSSVHVDLESHTRLGPVEIVHPHVTHICPTCYTVIGENYAASGSPNIVIVIVKLELKVQVYVLKGAIFRCESPIVAIGVTKVCLSSSELTTISKPIEAAIKELAGWNVSTPD